MIYIDDNTICDQCPKPAMYKELWPLQHHCKEHATQRRESLGRVVEWHSAHGLDTCEHCGALPPVGEALVTEPHSLSCQECHDNCPHEFDSEEGYMCLNCGADGYEHMAGAAEYLYD